MAINSVNANSNANSSLMAKAQSLLPAANNDNLAGMRMAAPLANVWMQRDTFKAAKQMINGGEQASQGFRMMDAGAQASGGGLFHNIGSKFSDMFHGAFGGALKTFGHALKSNFMVSAIFSGISNVYELATGKVDAAHAAGNFVADTAAYTAIGATATTIGATIGSFLGPLGTIGGMAIGFGVSMLLGKLYEDKLRPSFSSMATQAVQSLGTSASNLAHNATAPTATPVPTPAR